MIRAAGSVADVDEIIIIGSQAVLGQYPDAPAECLRSMEVDVWTRRDPNDAEVIDGSIGELSPFHSTFGYYAHGVGRETAVLPDGWETRLVVVENANTRGVRGLCLEVHDLAVSKLVAGREKDITYVATLIDSGIVNRDTVERRLRKTPLEMERRALAEGALSRAVR